MRTEWITHHGTKIYFVDYADLDAVAAVELVDSSFGEVEKMTGSINMLCNFSNTTVGKKFVESYTNWCKRLKAKMGACAVYGLNLPKRVMLNTFNAVNGMDIKAFETREQALEHICGKPA